MKSLINSLVIYFFHLSLAALDKEMRSWDAYINLDSTVKNMLTSLRAVAELQNPSLRERHWGQLLVATKTDSSTKNFVVRERQTERAYL